MSGMGLWGIMGRFFGIWSGSRDFRVIRGRSRHDFGKYILALWRF
jgi:hypothetical protein